MRPPDEPIPPTGELESTPKLEPVVMPPYFRGDGQVRPLGRLPDPPSWRRPDRSATETRGATFRIDQRKVSEAAQLVDAALLLRRPLLVTGSPGTGKSSLAYAVAYELGLGEVLVWSITSRSTLEQGLYTYDAVGRLQEAALRNPNVLATADAKSESGKERPQEGVEVEPPMSEEVGRFIRLGPLGTSLLPWPRPRVLLIDEIDKSDIDLPNDLLHVLEEGRYEIPELARLSANHKVSVWRYKSLEAVEIEKGQVACRAFPLVIMTSNGEREFPPAFLRRCLRLTLKEPQKTELEDIVASHFFPTKEIPNAEAESVTQVHPQAQAMIDEFFRLRKPQDGSPPRTLATDQLLNAVYLLTQGLNVLDQDVLRKAVLKSLSGEE